jgi:hypothetical protein
LLLLSLDKRTSNLFPASFSFVYDSLSFSIKNRTQNIILRYSSGFSIKYKIENRECMIATATKLSVIIILFNIRYESYENMALEYRVFL